jgi:glycosyltransferase involved in cell wall biosynthesis
MEMLGSFDRVFAVSQHSADELRYFQPACRPAEVLRLGADSRPSPRPQPPNRLPDPVILCLGILEPRKNQTFLLDVCKSLWAGGLSFELHFVGRVNPHFGRPILRAINDARRRGCSVWHHEGIADAEVQALYQRTRCTAFPTLAEGCGLPILESLWQGLPVVCSDLPVLRENTGHGGCLCLSTDNIEYWKIPLAHLLTDDVRWQQLSRAAHACSLPTWQSTAHQVLSLLT